MVWSQSVDVEELLSVMQLGVVVHEADTRIVAANSRALELLRITERQAMGVDAFDSTWQFLSWSGVPLTPEEYPVNLVAATGEAIHNYRIGIVKGDAEDISWVTCTAYQRAGDQRIVVTFIDITAETIANRERESALKTAEQSQVDLAAASSRLEVALAAIHAYTYDLEVASGVITFDDDFSSVLGAAPGTLQSVHLDTLRKISHPDDLEGRARALEAVFSGESPHYRNTARLRHADGHWVWVENQGRVLRRDTAGNITHLVGVLFDITARKDMESSLLQSQKMNALGTLAGGIAHDFNNLLVPILGYADLASRNLPEDAKASQYLAHVSNAALRAKALVENILLISRQTDADKQPVSVGRLVNEVIAVISASAPSDLSIVTDIDDDCADVLADANKIYQVILNLCTNAVQAMKGHGRLTIRVRSHVKHDTEMREPKHYAQLCVEDNGTGIEPAVLDQIFDPFFTTRTKGQQRGTGLGLSIAASVIEQHDGEITVQSTVGEGTLFTILLPTTDREIDTPPPQSSAKIATDALRVMLIDDEQAVRTLGEEMLAALGHTVTVFANPQQAIDTLLASPDQFDVVLTDYDMPTLNGGDVLKQIRAAQSDIPVILLTGYSQRAAPTTRSELGFDGYLPKPYDLETLRDVVGSAINGGYST